MGESASTPCSSSASYAAAARAGKCLRHQHVPTVVGGAAGVAGDSTGASYSTTDVLAEGASRGGSGDGKRVVDGGGEELASGGRRGDWVGGGGGECVGEVEVEVALAMTTCSSSWTVVTCCRTLSRECVDWLSHTCHMLVKDTISSATETKHSQYQLLKDIASHKNFVIKVIFHRTQNLSEGSSEKKKENQICQEFYE